MMPEQELPSSERAGGGGAGTGATGTPADSSLHGAEDVVHLADHRPGTRSNGSAESSGPGARGGSGTGPNGPDTVVDLRSTNPATHRSPVPVSWPAGERRSVGVAGSQELRQPAGPRGSENDRELLEAPVATLSSRVGRVMVPTVMVAVVTVIVAVASSLVSLGAHGESSQWAEAGDLARSRANAIESSWAGVVGLVAAGVGQPVTQSDQIDALLGDVGAAMDVSLPSGAADRELEQAQDRWRSFSEQVREAIVASDARPVQLGNQLEQLGLAQTDAGSATTALVRELDRLAEEAAARATRWLVVAVCCLLAGVALGVAAAERARRRLRSGLDLAVESLSREIDQVGEARPSPVVLRGFPELAWLSEKMRRRNRHLEEVVSSLRRQATWNEQSRRLSEALELADSERACLVVIERALAVVGDGRPTQLLLAERGSATLRSVASNPSAPPPACPVESTTACVAIRRGQVSVFDSSESINACPKLVGRESGPCSAVCVPVTVAGRPVGVVHMTDLDEAPPGVDVIDRVVDLATRIGTRLTALRTLESSRQEASTDGLTGLPNRRALEAHVAELLDQDTPFVMVLADLDKFKLLNDNYGHETGDKALQLFAGVLRDNVRGNDVVARLGGEEFVLVYPNMSVEISLEAIDRVRAALARSLEATALPRFTCSFGIAHSSAGRDGDAVLRLADAGLLRAKDEGGDQAVVADADLAATIFSDDAPVRARRQIP